MNSGVYQIMNRLNYHMYIGSAINFNSRWNEHRRKLRKGAHHNAYLQNAWNKDGEESFEFSEIEFVDVENLIVREQYYFDLLRPEYNMSPTAGSSLGIKHSDETKKKIREALIGIKRSVETKQKISNARIGMKFSEATKQKMRKPKSEEHTRNNSISHKGQIPWNKGNKSATKTN